MPRPAAVSPPASLRKPCTGTPALIGWVAGCALQLQQPALWPWAVYAAGWLVALIAGLVGAGVAMRQRHRAEQAQRQVLAAAATVAMPQPAAEPQRPYRAVWAWCAVAACAALAGFALTGWRAAEFQSHAMPPAWEGRDVRLQGVVVSLPQQLERGQRWLVAVEAAHDPAIDPANPQAAVPLPPMVSLALYGDSAERTPTSVQPGDRWVWTVRLKAPHAVRNPQGRDGELWLWSQGIQATGYVRQGARVPPPQWLGSIWQAPIAQLRARVRERMRSAGAAPPARQATAGDGDADTAAQVGVVDAAAETPSTSPTQTAPGAATAFTAKVAAPMAPPHAVDAQGWWGHVGQRLTALQPAAAGVVTALVTGDQAAIATPQWQLFRDTGVAHLVSISGLHITMFAWLAVAVVGALWRRSARLCLWCPAPWAAGWAGLALAAAYALFSGWGIPAQRTLGMLLVVVALRARGWVWPWPYVWLLVLAVVVAWDPWALLQPGFWLSFVAVGVLFAAQPQARGAESASASRTPSSPTPMRWAWRHTVGRLLREQAVVGIALAPLTVLLFGQLSLVGFVANLWAIPWVTLVVTPLAMLGMVWPPLWTVAGACVQAMLVLLEAMAGWPGAVAYFPQAPLWAGLAGVLGCALLVVPLPWRLRLLGLPLVLPMLLWQPPRPAPGAVEVLALDVGQGSAVLLRTATHSLLVDAGPRWSEQADAGERTVVPLLRAWGEHLHGVLITHADSDHAGGAAAVLAAQPQAWLMGSGLEALAPAWGRTAQPCAAGQAWTWDGVRFTVLHPPAEGEGSLEGAAPLDPSRRAAPRTRNAANAISCVLRVDSADGAAALLTGDIEAAQEQWLLQSGAPLQAQLVVVPHHGSRTSSTPALVQAVAPHVAIVQSGYLNRFGHPVPAVVDRWVRQGAQVVSSPQCGAALWRSNAPAEVACERAEQPRYWQHPGP